MVDTGKFQPHELLEQLDSLRSEMLDLEASGHIEFDGVHVDHRASATNLLHYLALRRHDIRGLIPSSPLSAFPPSGARNLTSLAHCRR
jgi:hypothetical protein